MGRSQETSNKKEVKNKKDKKRKEKEKKRLIKKETGKKASFDDMIAYVDEFGMISSTPPDPDKKSQVIDADTIVLGATKNDSQQKSDYIRKGVVTFFNESKGFGFIRDMENNQSVFVHVNNLVDTIKENNIVIFELGKGPKGFTALNVKLFKER
ncbi:MAG: cold shock domain-containing protein [Bacteroidales bacterium]|nr:cold shock domain-containing protein [Bacteroidales bacterium]